MSEYVQTAATQLPSTLWTARAPPVKSPCSPGLDLLDHIGIVLGVRRDQEIYGQDDPADHYFHLMRGSLRTVKLMADGRRQVSEFLLPGDLFGFDALDRHDFATEALEDSLVRRYPRREVEALAQQSMPLLHRLRQFTAARLRQAHERMQLLGCMSASQRIASFLLQMSDRAPVAAMGRIELAMSRRDIADYLGLTIETVSRTLTQLRHDGTIAMFKRVRIEIRDRGALECTVREPPH